MSKLIAEDKSNPKVVRSGTTEDSPTDQAAQIEEELARNLSSMKVILQGTPGMFASVVV